MRDHTSGDDVRNRVYEHRGYRVVEDCSIEVGEGERLDYWEAVRDLAGESCHGPAPETGYRLRC